MVVWDLGWGAYTIQLFTKDDAYYFEFDVSEENYLDKGQKIISALVSLGVGIKK